MKFPLAKYILLLVFTHNSINCLGQKSPYKAKHIKEKISLNIYAGLGLESSSSLIGIGYTYDYIKARRIHFNLGFNYELTRRVVKYHFNYTFTPPGTISSHAFKASRIGHRIHFPLNMIFFTGRKLKLYFGVGYHLGYFLAETNDKYDYQYTYVNRRTTSLSPAPEYDISMDSSYDELIQNVNNLDWKIVNELYLCIGYNIKKSRFELFIKGDVNGRYATGFAGFKYRKYLPLY